MTQMQTTGDVALGWFSALRDDAADEAVWLAFQEWLDADPSHAAAYDDVERLWLVMEDLAPPQAANVDVPTFRVSGREARPRRRFIYSAMAASVAAALGLGVWMQSSGQGGSVIYRTEDAPRDVRLSDGSTIAMNRRSEIEVNMGQRGRRVDLRTGEADFDIVHDPARPFVVVAGPREVEVLGTAFDVINDGARFELAVSRGVVAVKPAGPFPAVRLPAGHRLVQTLEARPHTRGVAPSQTAEWRRGVLVYRNGDLASVAADLSRYFGKPVVVSTSAASLTFTGTLRIADQETMLRQLEGFLPIRAQEDAGGVRLETR